MNDRYMFSARFSRIAHIAFSWVAFTLLFIGVWQATSCLLESPPLGSYHNVTIVMFWVLLGLFRAGELIWPWRSEWVVHQKDLTLDVIGHGIVTNGLTGLITGGVLLGALHWASQALHAYTAITWWPHHWGMPAQVFLAVAIGDLGFYWVHRAAHTYRIGWIIHAVHHSAHRLYVGSAFRNHPLNVVAGFFAQNAANTVLGVSEPVATLAGIMVIFVGMLQHANINWRFGWLNYVLATAEMHRFHHSKLRAEELSNFSGTLIWWDWMFGTLHYNREQAGPDATGVEGLKVPRTYWAHMQLPWRLWRSP